MLLFLTVYHYQLKIHFSSKVNRSEMEPSLTVSLYGTNDEAENLELKLWVHKTEIQHRDLHLLRYRSCFVTMNSDVTADMEMFCLLWLYHARFMVQS